MHGSNPLSASPGDGIIDIGVHLEPYEIMTPYRWVKPSNRLVLIHALCKVAGHTLYTVSHNACWRGCRRNNPFSEAQLRRRYHGPRTHCHMRLSFPAEAERREGKGNHVEWSLPTRPPPRLAGDDSELSSLAGERLLVGLARIRQFFLAPLATLAEIGAVVAPLHRARLCAYRSRQGRCSSRLTSASAFRRLDRASARPGVGCGRGEGCGFTAGCGFGAGAPAAIAADHGAAEAWAAEAIWPEPSPVVLSSGRWGLSRWDSAERSAGPHGPA